MGIELGLRHAGAAIPKPAKMLSVIATPFNPFGIRGWVEGLLSS